MLNRNEDGSRSKKQTGNSAETNKIKAEKVKSRKG